MNTVFSAPLRRWLLRLAAFLLALCVPFLLLLGCIGFVPETSRAFCIRCTISSICCATPPATAS